MWNTEMQKKILLNIKKEKDIYKFLELVSFIHTEIAEDFKKQKLLNLREDLEFIEELMGDIKPKEEPSKNKKPRETYQNFDKNIFYTLEGLYLGLNKYLNNKPKDEIIEKTTEKDIKEILEEAYRYLATFKQEDLEICKEKFSNAAAFILSGVPVNEYFASQVSYKKDNRLMLWTESIMQIIEHSKDYPITTPSDFQDAVDTIWKNLKNYKINVEDLSSPNVKENYKKITVLLTHFIKEFFINKTEVEKALKTLRPMYIEYIDKLTNPKVKKEKALSISRSFVGESKLLDCEIVNINSDVINPLIQEYNKKYSKKVDLIQDDYITVWKVTLQRTKFLSKKPMTVLVDSIDGDIVGTYL